MNFRALSAILGASICLWLASGRLPGAAPKSAQTGPNAVMIEGFTADGSASVDPATGVAGQFGTWTVTCRVGRGGIATGGGIRVQLPDSWHAGPRNSAHSLQATRPTADQFIKAYPSRAGVVIETVVESETEAVLVKHPKESLDGRKTRYVFVVRARVTAGQLQDGDTIAVVYGDRSGGSRGMQAGEIDTDPEPILIGVDAVGRNQFLLLRGSPRIQAVSGKPAELEFHAPSQAAVNQPIHLHVSLLDDLSNPARKAAHLVLTQVTGMAEFPSTVEIPADPGYARFTVTPRANGVVRLRAEARELGLVAVCNPVDVATELPARKVYWGDLHSHTTVSWDGVGNHSFDYARNVSCLDFYARTDHSQVPEGPFSNGLDEKNWAEYTALADKYNDPPDFVTIQAYECSFNRPYGHHNVYFRGRPGPLVYPTTVTLEALWKMLQVGDALTIPHHTGKFPGGIEFSHHDPSFRRNFEIYSGHGLSEVYNPAHPLSFEHSKFTDDSRSLPAPTFAVDAWKGGMMVSTIASSDDHRAHPGRPNIGMAAVRAPALTRNDIFQALYDRQTYGTTGSRIILDFTLNNTTMGQTATVSGSPSLHIRCLGTDVIATVELLRYQLPGEKFAVIKMWQPGSMDFEDGFMDTDCQPGAIYYVRVTQANTVQGLVAMAWSSPIWTQGK